MRRLVTGLGWCLGVVATALWLSAYTANRSLKEELNELSTQYAHTLSQIDRLSKSVADSTGQLHDADLSQS